MVKPRPMSPLERVSGRTIKGFKELLCDIEWPKILLDFTWRGRRYVLLFGRHRPGVYLGRTGHRLGFAFEWISFDLDLWWWWLSLHTHTLRYLTRCRRQAPK